MDQKEAFKADRKGKKKSESWAPHTSQLEYLKFMKGELLKLHDEPHTTVEKFKKASEAWKQHCVENGKMTSGASGSNEDASKPADHQDDVADGGLAVVVADADEADVEKGDN